MWTKTNRKSTRGAGFLARTRDTPYDEDSSDNRSKRAKLDPNLISGLMADELDYQFTLAELSVSASWANLCYYENFLILVHRSY